MKEGISHHVARIVSKNHGFEGSMPFVCSFARRCTEVKVGEVWWFAIRIR